MGHVAAGGAASNEDVAMEEMEDALLKENKISPSLSGNEDVVEEEHNLRDPRLFTTFNY